MGTMFILNTYFILQICVFGLDDCQPKTIPDGIDVCICTKVSDNGQKYEFYIKRIGLPTENQNKVRAKYQNNNPGNPIGKTETIGTVPVVIGKF